MAASQTEVVNMGLAELGSDLITSLTDPSKAATLASASWQPVTKAVMRAYPWKCIKTRKTLSPDGTQPEGDKWDQQFTLPPNCLRVLTTNAPGNLWTVEGRKLLANTDEVHIEYLKYEEDITKWDDLLAAAVAARLGHQLCYALTQSQSLKDNMWESYKKKVQEARSIDAQEGGDQVVGADNWIEERVT